MSSPADNFNIAQLWPVSILTSQFSQHREINPQLVELFLQYRDAHPNRAGGAAYSSPDNFAQGNDNPALLALEKFIMDNVFAVAAHVNRRYWEKNMAKNIRGGAELSVKLTGMWFQISNDFGFHQIHSHGNCSWSGVYYVQAGSSSRNQNDLHENGMPNGITRFYGPHGEYLAGGHGDHGNYYLHDYTHDSYPEDGKLCVFPSHLKHMVFPYQGDKDRIIVSFNAIVDGDAPLRHNYAFS